MTKGEEEAEVGLIHLQAKEPQGSPAAEERPGMLSSSETPEETSPAIPWPQN